MILRGALVLYSLLYTAALALYFPFYWYRVRFRERQGVDLGQRLGRLPESFARRPQDGPVIWLHAVSVGEVNAMSSLVETLAPGPDRLFISTTTDTGQEQAQRRFGGMAQCFYFPVDFGWTCRRFLKSLRPTLVILAEGEFWPRFVYETSRLGIPLVLVNGRISDRSFGRYRRLRFLYRRLWPRFSALCMQTKQDKKRMLDLGAEESRVRWLGNLKFDYSLREDASKEVLADRLLALLKPDDNARLWICGSTREGEEEILIACFQRLAADFPSLRLLVAPRHPHRAPEVEQLLAARGIPAVARSALEKPLPDNKRHPRAVVLDSIGELAYLYRIADVVFIGGSLFATGGHNIIEAAYFGKPVLFGPHMENFREVARLFTESYAALQVGDPEELVDRLSHLLRDPHSADWLARNARKVMRMSQGAVARTEEVLGPFLGTLSGSSKKAPDAHSAETRPPNEPSASVRK